MRAEYQSSATLIRDAGKASATLSIDGAIECTGAIGRSLSQTQIQLDVKGSFPSTAIGSSDSMTFNGITGLDSNKTAHWTLNIPTATPDGVQVYHERLSWTDDVSNLEKSCYLTTTVALLTAAAPNQTPTVCPVPDGFLCSNLPGFGASPTNFCTLDRLSAITSIPEICPVGACLMIVTMPPNVITLATCWDSANSQPLNAP